jgi:hypothetical protein
MQRKKVKYVIHYISNQYCVKRTLQTRILQEYFIHTFTDMTLSNHNLNFVLAMQVLCSFRFNLMSLWLVTYQTIYSTILN